MTTLALRGVACVDDSGAAGKHLAYGVERGHPEPGRKVHLCVLRDSGGPAQGKKVRIAFKHRLHSLERAADVEFHIRNPQEFDELYGVGYVALNAVGHQHADDSVFTEGLCAERSGYAGVLSTRDTDHGLASLAVLLEVFPDPLHDFVFGLNRVFEHFIPVPPVYMCQKVQLNV